MPEPRDNSLKENKSKLIRYFMISFIISILVACLGFLKSVEPQWLSLMSLVAFLLFGWLHNYQLKKRFISMKWGTLLDEDLFTLCTVIVGFMGFAVTYFLLARFLSRYFYLSDYIWMMASSIIIFPIPFLIERIFDSAIDIPEVEYKKWFFPDKPIDVDRDDMDLKNFAVITFLFTRVVEAPELSNFQSKAPYSIKMGDLFYFFIQEWNYKNPDKEIQYLDPENKSFGWYFFIKDKWWHRKKYLDADFTISQSGIKVNRVIHAERVIL